jgi:ABC-type Fe3+/spermidine/putrescine transport system ATPase subunit
MEEIAIEIHKIFVTLDGSREILRDLSVVIERGHCLVVLGPSGSGKTTLLRTIAGFVRPREGMLKIFGEDMHGIPPESRKVSMLFQNRVMFEEQTVEENALCGQLRHKNRHEALNRLVELAEIFKFKETYLKKKYMELSGGEQQKAAFIRTFANAKKIVLLDEPIRAAFDLHQRWELMRGLREITQRERLTTVIVTHEFEEAAYLADNVMVLNPHRSWTNSLEELYRNPAHQHLARVLGYGNELRAEILIDESLREKLCPLVLRGSLPNCTNAKVAFFRPSSIQIDPNGRGFVVERVVFSGNNKRVMLRSNQDGHSIEAEVKQDIQLNIYQNVDAIIQVRDIKLFDKNGDLVR